MRTINCIVQGTPEQQQQVEVEFDGRWVSKFYGNQSTFFVNHCAIINEMTFFPKYTKDDLEIAIAEALGIIPERVRFECEVEFLVKYEIVNQPVTI